MLDFHDIITLEPHFSGTEHVKLSGVDLADDHLIWDYAKENGLTIVTQDADFELLAQFRGSPPKII